MGQIFSNLRLFNKVDDLEYNGKIKEMTTLK